MQSLQNIPQSLSSSGSIISDSNLFTYLLFLFFKTLYWICLIEPSLLLSYFSGRFDFHVQLVSPAVSERGQILKHEIEKRALLCPDDIVSEIAAKCDGYDAYDLVLISFLWN